MGAQPQSRNNSKKFLQNAPKNGNTTTTNQTTTMFGNAYPHNHKKPTFAYNISEAVQYKNMRTNSQTSIHSEKAQQQQQQPQRSINNKNNYNQEKKDENAASNDYNLLVKLK